MKANGALKVEKGIPIPESHGTTRKGFAQVMRSMKVGESVLLPSDVKHPNNAAQYALGTGNYACRREKDGTRVWRIK